MMVRKHINSLWGKGAGALSIFRKASLYYKGSYKGEKL